MYFFLSKLLVYLVYPFLWICALVVIALITKNARRKRRLLISALVLLYVFSCPWLLNLYAKAWNVKTEVPNDSTTYSAVIILGGFSSGDKGGRGYFNENSARFIEGIKLYASGRVQKIMVTGGNGNPMPDAFSEAKWVKTQLEMLHYPDSSIVIESNSRNTIENADFSKPMIEKAGLKPPYILLTSDYHMRRARMIFTNRGYKVVPYSVYTDGNNGFDLSMLIPDAATLGEWNIYTKELVGYIVNYYKTKP
jgi:uncharacterized SAM-binding protein YcdF (DUF218 family)